MSWRVLKALPMLVSWVFTSGASLVTSISTFVAETCIVKFIVAGVFTCSVTFSRFCLANPLALTSTV